MHFAKYPELVKDQKVVEFGAASALPSLVALHVGAKVAIMTDYPNDLILKNINQNIKRNEHLLGSGKYLVRGHLWGSDTTGLLKCLNENEPSAGNNASDKAKIATQAKFDVAVVAECLWLHDLVKY